MLSETAQALLRDMAEFEIIDCHEHLGPERNRVAAQVDVFTLFAHYTRGDLAVAGMSDAQYQSLFNRDIPLARRWAVFEPFWEQIRWGSYARAALLAAQRKRQRADALVFIVVVVFGTSGGGIGERIEMARHVNRRVGPDGSGPPWPRSGPPGGPASAPPPCQQPHAQNHHPPAEM